MELALGGELVSRLDNSRIHAVFGGIVVHLVAQRLCRLYTRRQRESERGERTGCGNENRVRSNAPQRGRRRRLFSVVEAVSVERSLRGLVRREVYSLRVIRNHPLVVRVGGLEDRPAGDFDADRLAGLVAHNDLEDVAGSYPQADERPGESARLADRAWPRARARGCGARRTLRAGNGRGTRAQPGICPRPGLHPLRRPGLRPGAHPARRIFKQLGLRLRPRASKVRLEGSGLRPGNIESSLERRLVGAGAGPGQHAPDGGHGRHRHARRGPPADNRGKLALVGQPLPPHRSIGAGAGVGIRRRKCHRERACIGRGDGRSPRTRQCARSCLRRSRSIGRAVGRRAGFRPRLRKGLRSRRRARIRRREGAVPGNSGHGAGGGRSGSTGHCGGPGAGPRGRAGIRPHIRPDRGLHLGPGVGVGPGKGPGIRGGIREGECGGKCVGRSIRARARAQPRVMQEPFFGPFLGVLGREPVGPGLVCAGHHRRRLPRAVPRSLARLNSESKPVVVAAACARGARKSHSRSRPRRCPCACPRLRPRARGLAGWLPRSEVGSLESVAPRQRIGFAPEVAARGRWAAERRLRLSRRSTEQQKNSEEHPENPTHTGTAQGVHGFSPSMRSLRGYVHRFGGFCAGETPGQDCDVRGDGGFCPGSTEDQSGADDSTVRNTRRFS